MPGKSLKQQVAAFRQSLFCEEILNGQFTCLEELEGEDNPNFVQTIVNMYLNESPKYVDTIEQTLEALIPIDVANLERCLYKFKGRSSSIGANKVTIEITKMLDCCISGDIEGCRVGLSGMKEVYDTLHNKLKAYLTLLQQANAVTSGPKGRDG